MEAAGVEELETAAKAGQLSQEVIARILAGKKITFRDSIDQWIEWLSSMRGASPNTVNNYRYLIQAFLKLGHVTEKDAPSKIDERMVFDFINKKDGVGVEQRRQRKAVMAAFLDFCSIKGWTVGNAAKLVSVRMELLDHGQKERRSRNPLTDDEVRSLLAATKRGSFDHAAVAIARWTGLRLGDIAKLEMDSLSKPGRIIVWTDKRDKRVDLPLEPRELADAIASCPPLSSKYLFPSERVIAMDSSKRAALSVKFNRLFKKVGLVDKNFHDLRSSYIQDCVSKGIPTPHIAKSVGHSSIHTTLGYLPKPQHEGD